MATFGGTNLMKDDAENTDELDEEVVPFDDCLRLLVNTPPQPKKGKDKPPPDEGEEKEPES
jgi:hypothetical protein